MSTPLGEFLRARRDSTSPESLGLTGGARRRAPGIRRSELATLAGVSVEYLTRIEQGRDRNPSPQIVRALADALDLDAVERDHLRNLTKITAGACTAGAPVVEKHYVRPPVAALLRQYEPGIALVVNGIGDILATTDVFGLVAGPCGLLDSGRPNLARYVFTDPRARSVFPDWALLADELAFDLWNARAASLVAELTAVAGDDLLSRLHGNTVPVRGRLRWEHRDVGVLNLSREVLRLPPADNQNLVVLLPADDATVAAIQTLRSDVARPLRVVT